MRRSRIIAALAGAFAIAAGAHIVYHEVLHPTYLRFRTKFGCACVFQVEDDAGRPVRLLEVGGVVQSGTYVDDADGACVVGDAAGCDAGAGDLTGADTGDFASVNGSAAIADALQNDAGKRYTDLVFEYLKTYDLMFDAERPIRRVCVLGCGGYDYPEHLIANRPGTVVDAVEIDPAITSIAERYFYLDRLIAEYDTEHTGRLKLVQDDALAHLLATDTVYDAIVNDTFDGGKPPAHLTTPEFLSAVHARLTHGGLYLTNIVSQLEGPGASFLQAQCAFMRQTFEHVYVFPCADDAIAEADNVIVAATDMPLPPALAERSL